MSWILPFLKYAAFVRRPLGLCFFVLAVLGFILPIIPSWPFAIPAIALLGRRDPLLRHTHLLLRHALRWMRRSRTNWIRAIGMRASTEYVRARRMMTPAIIAAERQMSRITMSSGVTAQ